MSYTHFEYEITLLNSQISKLLTIVLRSFEDSLKSLEDKNINLAQQVLESDYNIDELNHIIEESVYQIVSKFRPTGKDLRYMVSIIKFANNLERIGDLSCNIAEKLKHVKALKLRRF